MRTPLRVVLVLVSAVAALYFVFWVGGAFLMAFGAPFWVNQAVALVAAAATGRYVWRSTASRQAGVLSSIMLGAFTLGAVGFVGGFFGPLLLAPGANQGPLLGIFITGPLGFALGAILGATHWYTRGRHRVAERSESTAG